MRYSVELAVQPSHNAIFNDPWDAADHAHRYAPHPGLATYYHDTITQHPGVPDMDVILAQYKSQNGETVIIKEVP